MFIDNVHQSCWEFHEQDNVHKGSGSDLMNKIMFTKNWGLFMNISWTFMISSWTVAQFIPDLNSRITRFFPWTKPPGPTAELDTYGTEFHHIPPKKKGLPVSIFWVGKEGILGVFLGIKKSPLALPQGGLVGHKISLPRWYYPDTPRQKGARVVYDSTILSFCST